MHSMPAAFASFPAHRMVLSGGMDGKGGDTPAGAEKLLPAVLGTLAARGSNLGLLHGRLITLRTLSPA